MLFAATDVGVFDRKDGDAYWYKISVGMPEVPVLDVKLSGDSKSLYVATFGRSMFELNLSTDATDGGGAGGSVPATLALTLGAPASFGPFTPGVDREYTASTTANVISTAGDATLSVSDPCCLTNGAFSLPEPIQVSFSKSTWDGAGVQRPGGDLVQAAHRRQPGAAHRQLLQDADVHALDDEPVTKDSALD